MYLLGVPADDNDIPEWCPAILQQSAKAANDLVKGCGTRRRVSGAHDPCCEIIVSHPRTCTFDIMPCIPSRWHPMITVSFLICPGMAATVFHIGITFLSTVVTYCV